MKANASVRAIGILLLIPVSAVLCFAQTPEKIQINLPFPFYVGDRAYDSGQYTLILDNACDSVILTAPDRSKTIFMTHDIGIANEKGENRLIFTNEGGRQVLHQVWLAGDSHGHDILHSKDLTELAMPK